MRSFLFMLVMGAGYLLQIGGGIVLVGLFFYGAYALFTISIGAGLMMIGAAVVGGWVIQIVSVLLIGLGMGVASIGVKDDGKD